MVSLNDFQSCDSRVAEIFKLKQTPRESFEFRTPAHVSFLDAFVSLIMGRCSFSNKTASIEVRENSSMKIKIYGCESLGVRSLACRVETSTHNVFIDPGVALAPNRYKLPPHPVEMKRAQEVQAAIQADLADVTHVVFSHYHGDHHPMVEADPSQLSAHTVASSLKSVPIYSKSLEGLSKNQKRRRSALEQLLDTSFTDADGTHTEPLTFSEAVWHGEAETHLGKVIMTQVKQGSESFVHGSDIQLLHDQAVEILCHWKPDVVFFSGPPLYILRSPKKLEATKAEVLPRIERIANACGTVIIDHHLLRNKESEAWLDELANQYPNITCAADFINQPRQLLECERKKLYQDQP